MTGPRTSNRFFLPAVALDRQYLRPIFPILVFNDDRNGRPNGFRVPNAADDVRAIGLDFHAPAAPKPLLAPPQLPIDGCER